MRESPMRIAIILQMVIAFEGAAIAKTLPSGACERIKSACEDAGFTRGGGKGHRLQADCVAPILRGTSQPGRPGEPAVPPIEPQVAQECRLRNPNFGQDAAPEAAAVAPRTGVAAPHGISAVNAVDAQRVGKLFETSDPKLDVYDNPNTSGVSFRTSWADVEPEEGKFDFAKLDAVFERAEKGHKWVALVLIPGFGTPAWALKGVQSGTFAIEYGPGNGSSLPLPAPWDQTYLSRWFTFLKAIGNRYGGKSSFRKIAAAGPTSVSAEMSLPDAEADMSQWKELGYTTQKYIDAWKQTFAAYSATFPHQCFSLALHAALPIPDKKQRTYGRDQVVALGLQYPGQFALQADGLNSKSTDGKYGYRTVREHNGQVATGFMMSASATRKSGRMGVEGDPVESLRLSIATGLVPNDHGQVIDYIELYEPDVVNPALQPLLHDTQQKLSKDPQ